MHSREMKIRNLIGYDHHSQNYRPCNLAYVICNSFSVEADKMIHRAINAH